MEGNHYIEISVLRGSLYYLEGDLQDTIWASNCFQADSIVVWVHNQKDNFIF